MSSGASPRLLKSPSNSVVERAQDQVPRERSKAPADQGRVGVGGGAGDESEQNEDGETDGLCTKETPTKPGQQARNCLAMFSERSAYEAPLAAHVVIPGDIELDIAPRGVLGVGANLRPAFRHLSAIATLTPRTRVGL